MTAKLTVRDFANTDDDGAAYEFTGTPAKVAGYLNGPVRGDLSTAEAATRLDKAIVAVRAGDVDAANIYLNGLSIYIHEASA